MIMEFVVKCLEVHTVYVELKETISTIFKYLSTEAIAALLAAPKRTIKCPGLQGWNTR
jgi:hypothetical protein